MPIGIPGNWTQIHQLLESLTEIILQYDKGLGLFYVEQKHIIFLIVIFIQTIWDYNFLYSRKYYQREPQDETND